MVALPRGARFIPALVKHDEGGRRKTPRELGWRFGNHGHNGDRPNCQMDRFPRGVRFGNGVNVRGRSCPAFAPRRAMAKNGLRAAGLGGPAGPFSESLVGEFQKTDTWIAGAFAIEQGFLFTAMVLSAAVVGVIERRWRRAAAWSAFAALLSACGLMHSYQWTFGDTALRLAPT